MQQSDVVAALQSPTTKVVLGAVGTGLVWVLAREVRKIPAQLLTLMFAAFLDMVGLLMIVPVLPFYVKRLCGEGTALFGVNIGPGVVSGFIVSAFTVAQLISAPLWGRFSDRHGRRPTLLIALGASAVAYLVFGFADSLWLLLLSRLVQGAGGGTVGVIQAYVADSTAPEQRARALGWLSAATNLGVALGPVMATFALWLGHHDLLPGNGELRLGQAGPGVIAALLCALNMAFAARYLRESKQTTARPADQPRVRTQDAIWRVVAHPTEAASRLILIYAIAIGAFQGINAVLALFLGKRFGIDEHSIGFFFMYVGAMSVYARVLLLGPLVDRLGEARLSRIGIVTLAAGIAGMAMCNSLPTLALAAGMLPLGTALTFPCVTALLSRVVPSADRGLYMGLQQTYGGLARIAAPLFYGWAFDNLDLTVPFWFSALFVLATLSLGVGLGRYVKPRAPAAA
jgi:MFS family permease